MTRSRVILAESKVVVWSSDVLMDRAVDLENPPGTSSLLTQSLGRPIMDLRRGGLGCFVKNESYRPALFLSRRCKKHFLSRWNDHRRPTHSSVVNFPIRCFETAFPREHVPGLRTPMYMGQ